MSLSWQTKKIMNGSIPRSKQIFNVDRLYGSSVLLPIHYTSHPTYDSRLFL